MHISVDNIFVIVLVFTAFEWHKEITTEFFLGHFRRYRYAFHLHLRAALIEKFSWIMYVFGAFFSVYRY